MKKLNVIIATGISLFANSLCAQEAYVNINAGYGFAMGSQNFPGFNNSTSGNNSFTNEQVNVSLGKGLNVGGAFGYMFNKNIGAELGLSYLIGAKTKAKDEYMGGTTDYSISSRMLRINPTLVIASGLEKINPYAKFGFIIGSGAARVEYKDNDEGDIEIMKMKMNGGLAFGVSSSVGALFSLSDKMSFFGEITMVNMSYATTKGMITEASYNGADLLPDMTTNEKETEYVKSYTRDFNNQPSDAEPSTELREKLPFGSLGINFGLKISF